MQMQMSVFSEEINNKKIFVFFKDFKYLHPYPFRVSTFNIKLFLSINEVCVCLCVCLFECACVCLHARDFEHFRCSFLGNYPPHTHTPSISLSLCICVRVCVWLYVCVCVSGCVLDVFRHSSRIRIIGLWRKCKVGYPKSGLIPHPFLPTVVIMPILTVPRRYFYIHHYLVFIQCHILTCSVWWCWSRWVFMCGFWDRCSDYVTYVPSIRNAQAHEFLSSHMREKHQNSSSNSCYVYNIMTFGRFVFRFKEGLSTLRMLGSLQQHPGVFRDLFCTMAPTLSAQQMEGFFFKSRNWR